MSITNLDVFSALRTKMSWHQARQKVLAENVANAETPNYRARDLRTPDFEDRLVAEAPGGLNAVRTHQVHIAAAGPGATNTFQDRRATTFETTPEGNSVVLEEEMMKVAANQMDFQAVAMLYQRGIGMLRTAIGKRA